MSNLCLHDPIHHNLIAMNIYQLINYYLYYVIFNEEPKALAIQKEQNIQNYLDSLFCKEFVPCLNKQLMTQQAAFLKFQFHTLQILDVFNVISHEIYRLSLVHDH